MALVVLQPGAEDQIKRIHTKGDMWKWFEGAILRKLSLTWDDLIVSSLLRCYNPALRKKKKQDELQEDNEAVTGWLFKQASRCCRQFDNHHLYNPMDTTLVTPGLLSFPGDCFFVNFGLENMKVVAAMEAIALSVMQKAVKFAEAGYRPIVLMGKEPLQYVAPELLREGGHRNWIGHWWEGSWPKSDTTDDLLQITASKPQVKNKKIERRPEIQGSLF